MSQALSRPGQTDDLVASVILKNDLSGLQPGQRVEYLVRLAQHLGLDPITKPFDLLTLNGKVIPYANKSCTDQLRNMRGVSIAILSREIVGDNYIVTAKATLPDGRCDEDIGAINIGGLKGQDLANAKMKGETKAKRRVTLSICGLGMMDESEVDDARPVKHQEPASAGVEGLNAAIRSRKVVENTAEVKPVQPAQEGGGAENAAPVGVATPAQVDSESVETWANRMFNYAMDNGWDADDYEKAARAKRIEKGFTLPANVDAKFRVGFEKALGDGSLTVWWETNKTK